MDVVVVPLWLTLNINLPAGAIWTKLWVIMMTHMKDNFLEN